MNDQFIVLHKHSFKTQKCCLPAHVFLALSSITAQGTNLFYLIMIYDPSIIFISMLLACSGIIMITQMKEHPTLSVSFTNESFSSFASFYILIRSLLPLPHILTEKTKVHILPQVLSPLIT